MKMEKINTETINIGMVSSPSLGGSGVVGSELAKYLAKKSQYKIVFIGDEFPFRLDEKDVLFYKVEKLNHALFTNPLSEAALTEGIVSAVLKYKLDIIHAHFAIPYAHCAIQAKEILKNMGIKVSVVTTLHGTDVLSLGLEVPAIMKHILRESDVVTAVSVNLADKTKEIYKTQKKINVVYNFVDFNNSSKLENKNLLRSKYAKKREKVFTHISNFRPIKRVADTINVFLKVQHAIPSVLLLIGEGPDTGAARKLAKSIRGQESIHFIGRVKNPYKYLKIADALIMTSAYESFSLAALEAMSCGVPVFGTRVGGVPEVIEDQKSGYLVELGDLDAMSSNIIQHFSDNKNVTRMRENARGLSEKFSAEKIVSQYEHIYNQLILSFNSTRQLNKFLSAELN